MKHETRLKKWSISDWKNEAWTLCSIYNRRKGTKDDYGYCCTCGKRLHWKDGDAGHFQSGRGNSILFYDKGIHLQCKQCNGPHSGEQYLYGLYIKNRYGKKELDKQVKMKHEIKKYTKEDYIKLVELYKNKLKELDGF